MAADQAAPMEVTETAAPAAAEAAPVVEAAPMEVAETAAPAAAEAAPVVEAPAATTVAEVETQPPTDAAAEEVSSVDVAEGLTGWLLGKGADQVKELERLSGARIEVGQEAPVDGKRKVHTKGTAVAVARARVLLEDTLRNAPSSSTENASRQPDVPAIMVAGHRFQDRVQLVAHVKALQSSIKDGSMLGPEDAFFIFHLATYHPQFMEKMTSPVVGFKYGSNQDFGGAKCFFIVRADGTESGISIKKCMDLVVPKHTQAFASSSSNAKAQATGSTAGVGGDDSAGRGEKRTREEGGTEEAGAPAAAKPKREIQKGCVLMMEGVPLDYDYETLREILLDFGNVRFVELLKPGDKGDDDDDSKESKAMDVDEGAGAKAIADGAVDNAVAAGTTAVVEDAPKEGGAEVKPAESTPAAATEVKPVESTPAAATEAPAAKVESASSEAASSSAKDSVEDKADITDSKALVAVETEGKAAADKCAGGGAPAEDGSKDKDTKEASSATTMTVRARFGDADGARKAVRELEDLDGAPVKLHVLEGEEERQFWERLWQKADAARESGKGKDKGKGKGKDKGKGKGKGKKGGKDNKGKGKGKKDR